MIETFRFGSFNHSWSSESRWETKEDAEDACKNTLYDIYIRMGYPSLDRYAIFKETYTIVNNETTYKVTDIIERVGVIVTADALNIDWETYLFNRIDRTPFFDREDFDRFVKQIDFLKSEERLTEYQADFLKNHLSETMDSKRIIKGDFVEGETVTVIVEGEIITRKVRYSKQAGDLYIVKDGRQHYYCEFRKG